MFKSKEPIHRGSSQCKDTPKNLFQQWFRIGTEKHSHRKIKTIRDHQSWINPLLIDQILSINLIKGYFEFNDVLPRQKVELLEKGGDQRFSTSGSNRMLHKNQKKATDTYSPLSSY